MINLIKSSRASKKREVQKTPSVPAGPKTVVRRSARKSDYDEALKKLTRLLNETGPQRRTRVGKTYENDGDLGPALATIRGVRLRKAPPAVKPLQAA
jgi:hypothetical protein